MSGIRCKQVVDGGRTNLADTLEAICKDELAQRAHLVNEDGVMDGKGRSFWLGYVQRLADIDIIAMHGGTIPNGGLLGIVAEWHKEGIFDDDVWKVLPRPRREPLTTE